MRLRRLIVVSHKYPPYASDGLARYIERSLPAIRQERPDLEITLYTLDFPDGQERHVLTDSNVHIRRLPVLPWIKSRYLREDISFDRGGRFIYACALLLFNLQVLLRLITTRRGSDTLLCVHDWQSTPAGIIASVLLNQNVVYHIHTTELTMTSPLRVYDVERLIRICEKTMGRLARCVIVTSDEMRLLLARQGWGTGNITVIPHGYEDRHFDEYRKLTSEQRKARIEQLRESIGMRAEERLILFVGRLSPTKGIHILIDAMPDVLAQPDEVRLVVAGVGFPGTDEATSVIRHVQALRLDHRCLVYNRYLDSASVALHYDAADLCVFPSLFEPFGLVAVEAMSFGKPLILGPAFPQAIWKEGQEELAERMTGKSPAELATLISKVLANPEAAMRKAGRAKRHVESHFSWKTTAARTVRAYDKARS